MTSADVEPAAVEMAVEKRGQSVVASVLFDCLSSLPAESDLNTKRMWSRSGCYHIRISH